MSKSDKPPQSACAIWFAARMYEITTENTLSLSNVAFFVSLDVNIDQIHYFDRFKTDIYKMAMINLSF